MSSSENSTKVLVTAAMLVSFAAVIIMFKQCKNNNEQDLERKKTERLAANIVIQDVNKVSEIDILVKQLEDKDKELSKIKAQLSFASTTTRKNLPLKVIYKHDTIRDTIFSIKHLSFKDSSLNLKVSVQTDSSGNFIKASIDTFQYKTSYEVTAGIRKKSFSNLFGPDQLVVRVKSNGLDSIHSVKNLVVIPERKWYEKKSTYFISGSIIGLISGFLLLQK